MKRLPEVVFSNFAGPVNRIVERQEHSATTGITDDLAEQQLLEEMLESSKPGQLNNDTHYLLGTPFRYPPLKYGSRFGSTFGRWIFYACLDYETCLYECAYYRFMLFLDMQEAPPNPVTTEHTMFTVDLFSRRCVDLCSAPYDAFQHDLRSVHSYGLTHVVGDRVRDLDGEMLYFRSARGPGRNAAVLDGSVFASRPYDQELWMSQTRLERVMFRGPRGVFQLPMEEFTDAEGRFPRIST